MTNPGKNTISDLINNYIGGRPFKALSNILENKGFYNKNSDVTQIIDSLHDSEYKNLKKYLVNLRKSVNNDIDFFEEQKSTNGEIDSFLQLISLILDVSLVIQKRDDFTMTNLKEKIESQNEPSSSQSKTKGSTDSQSKTVNDQSETISKLKKKLVKAIDQINSLKAQINSAKNEGKNEIIQGLSDHYHLDQSSSNDIQNLINSLDNCIEGNSTAQSDAGDNLNENVSLLKNIIQSFDLPPETTSQNIVSELQQKIAEMVKDSIEMSQKGDLENTPIGSNEDPSNPSILRSQLVATVNSLRSEIDHLRDGLAEQDEVLQIFCNIPLKPDQAESIVQEAENSEKSFIQKVRDIVSILAIQIFQSEDTEVLNTRLTSLVSGLFQFINAIGTSKAAYTSLYPEAPFEEMRPVILSQAERVHLFLCENAAAFMQDQKSLFDELITNTNYNTLKGLDANTVNSMNLLNHVKNYLNQYTQKPSSVEGQVLYVIALEAVSACDILQRYSETVKNACTKQIHEANQLKNYSIQLEKSIEDQQVYIQEMSLLQNEERNNNNTRSENYDYGDNYYDNDRESLSNSLNNANNRSRENSRNIDNNQSYDNSKDIDNNRRRRNENSHDNENSNNNNSKIRDNEKDEKELNKVRSILRKSLMTHKNEKENDNGSHEESINSNCTCSCIESILEALDHLNQKEVDIIPDDRYIQSLQTQLRDTITDNKELKKKNDNLIKETHDDIVNVQSQVSKMNETMNKRIELKTKQNQKLIKALKEAKETQDKLKKKNQELQKKLTQEASDESSKQIAEEIQQNFQETKKDYEEVLSQMKSAIESKQAEFDSLKESFEQEKKQLQDELSKEREKRQSLEKVEKKFKERIEKLKKKESKAIDQASILSEKYQALHKDIQTLENEKKSMMSSYENIEKEKSLIQASLKNYSDTLAEFDKLRKSHDQLLNDQNKESQQFLSKIASLFPTYADLSVTITKESILDVLKSVKEDLDTIPQYQEKSESNGEVIQQIKEALNIESESSIVEKLNALTKKNIELDQSNRFMYSELKASQDSKLVYLQLQDWLIRMYVLVTGGVCQDITTLEMQHAIEDNITSKYNNIILSRKNALLRAEKKLLTSQTYAAVSQSFVENDKEIQKATVKKETNEEEEEEANQSSTEVEIEMNQDEKNIKNKEKEKNKTKKKKDKRVYSFRHLLIMAMLICKAKRLSGNGEDPLGLDVGDANNNNNNSNMKFYSTSFSPISKPAINNYVFGLD